MSTFLCTPAWTSEDGDDRGRAADRAGGVHAQQRLPGGAERVGQEQLGHHHALEQVRRLADDDRVDLVERHLGVLEGAVDRLAAAVPPWRRPRAWRGGGSGPRRSRRPAACPSLALPFTGHHADEVLLQRRPGGGVAERLRRLARPDPLRGLADPDAAGGEHRVAGQRAARGVDPYVVTQAQLGAEDQLLVAERRVQLGHLDAVEVGGGRRALRRRGSASGRGSPCSSGPRSAPGS